MRSPRHRSWPEHHRLRRARLRQPAADAGRSRRRPRQSERHARRARARNSRRRRRRDRVAKPEVLAIEELYSHYDRPTTAILMGHARGVIVLAAAQAGIPVDELSGHADQKNDHRQRPRGEVANAGSHPPRIESAGRARTARRRRRPGHRPVPRLLDSHRSLSRAIRSPLAVYLCQPPISGHPPILEFAPGFVVGMEPIRPY